VTDRAAFSPLELGMVLATTLQRLYAEQSKIERIAKLLAHPATLEAIHAGEAVGPIQARWAADREKFRSTREQYLIYP